MSEGSRKDFEGKEFQQYEQKVCEGATLQGSNHKYTYHLALISMALRQRKADSRPETQVLALSQ